MLITNKRRQRTTTVFFQSHQRLDIIVSIRRIFFLQKGAKTKMIILLFRLIYLRNNFENIMLLNLEINN